MTEHDLQSFSLKGCWRVILGLALIALALCAAINIARAHSWYSDRVTPDHLNCCGGADCKPIRMGSVVEVKGGWIVSLTKAEMAEIRPSLAMISPVMSGPGGGGAFGSSENAYFKALPAWGISEFIPFEQGQPADDGNYSVCLDSEPEVRGGIGAPRWTQCFFYPSNT